MDDQQGHLEPAQGSAQLGPAQKRLVLGLGLERVQETEQPRVGVRNTVGHLNFVLVILGRVLEGKLVTGAISSSHTNLLEVQSFEALWQFFLVGHILPGLLPSDFLLL